MRNELAEMVYYTLIGEVSPPFAIPYVENAYAQGSECDKLYNEVCDAYDRLRLRLGVVDEDEDVEIIIGNLLSIQHTLCLKMYHCGTQQN